MIKKSKIYFLLFCLLVLSAGCGSEFGEMIDHNSAATRTTANDITSFVFQQAHNSSLSSDIAASINAENISATVPFGTDTSNLTPTIVFDGESIYPASDVAQNFSATNPITYTVTAADGSTKDFFVTVTEASIDTKEITAFSIDGVNGVIGTATGSNPVPITVNLPAGANASSLIATFSHTGQMVEVNGVVQASGSSVNDFTNPVTYTVSAVDGSTRDYIVTVSIGQSSAKTITSFAFTDAANTALSADASVTISGTTVTASVPYGTDISALVPTINVSTGASIFPASGSAQAFTDGVAKTYTVSAADGSAQDYSVIVNVGLNPAKDITAFNLTTALNAQFSSDIIGVISGTDITLNVDYGKDLSNLKPTISHTGASVNPASGVGLAFTDGVAMTFTVTAADSSTKNYSITVNVALNPAKDITSFVFEASNNGVLSTDVNSVINGTTISATVPFGTAITSLVPTITVSSGATVNPTSGTARDFSSAVTYTVTAEDSTSQVYTVTVSVAPNTQKDITSFIFRAADNAQLSSDVAGIIVGTNITATVPAGTTITSLVPTIAISGSSVSPNSGVAQNFSSTVNYTVTAGDASTQIYNVDVTVEQSSEKDITSFVFRAVDNGGLSGDFTGSINGTNISVTLPAGTTVTNLIPTISLSTGALVNPNTGVAQNFSSPVVYTVTAENSSTQPYTVTVSLSDTPIVWDNPVTLEDNISPNGQNVEKVRTAIDDDGNIIIVWQQSDGNYTQLYKAEYRNGTWSIPSSLSDCISQGTTSIQDIHVAMIKDNSSNKDAVITWNRSDGANIRLYKMEYRSGAWGSAAIISNSGSDAKKPHLGMSKDGTAMLAWKQNGYVTYSRYNGSWSAHATIGVYGNIDDDDLNIAMNDNGRAIVAWFQSSKPRASIYNGSWSSVEDLFPNGSNLSFPRVSLNNNNKAIAVYNSWYNTKLRIFKSEFDGSSWSKPPYLYSYFLSNETGDATVPYISLDSTVNNDAVITWRESNGTNQQVYMADRRSSSWNSSSKISPSGKDVLSSKIAMSTNGHAVITWLQPDSANNYQLFISEYAGGAWYHPSDLADNISPDGANVKYSTSSLYLNEYYFDIAISYNSVTLKGYKVIAWIQNDGNNDQLFVSRSQN